MTGPTADSDRSPQRLEEPEQAMACLSCGLAGMTPESHFPLPSGLWDQPCLQCGEQMVWVTDIRTKLEAE